MFVCLFKQKMAYELRISDWSSDVCSSELGWLVARRLLSVVCCPSFAACRLVCGFPGNVLGPKGNVFGPKISGPKFPAQIKAGQLHRAIGRLPSTGCGGRI